MKEVTIYSLQSINLNIAQNLGLSGYFAFMYIMVLTNEE